MSARLQTEPLQLRSMIESDLASIHAIEELGHLYPWSLTNFEDCLKAAYICRVAGSSDHIQGFSVMTIAVGEAHLLNVCVDPVCQGQGVGQTLVSDVIDVAVEKGVKIIFLEVRPSNVKAIHLYEKNGFNQVGKRPNYYPANKGREDAIIYALTITAKQTADLQ